MAPILKFNRRDILRAGAVSAGWLAANAMAPSWFARSAQAACETCTSGEKILVVLQHAGGIDGLNTVIPQTDAAYYAARPVIAVPNGQGLNLDTLNALHPRLSRIANWFQQGRAAILHNVGYVNPNLSHFVATDYYELGQVPGEPIAADGWLARYYDHACAGCAPPAHSALHFTTVGTSNTPKSFLGSENYKPPAVNSASSYAFSASGDRDLRLSTIGGLNSIETDDPELGFVQAGYQVAASSIANIATATAIAGLVPDGTYPTTQLGNGLKLASQVIRAGFPTKVFYVTQGGYDTHAGQVDAASPLTAGDHPRLLDEFDRAIDAFLTEMSLSGNIDRVVIMTYSEFGRRVGENGSRGTDHGAANCSFAFGAVKAGIYGGQPSLTDLISGSLKHKVDFRAVYARALQDLFDVNGAAVFGQAAYDAVIGPDMAKVPYIAVPTVSSHWRIY